MSGLDPVSQPVLNTPYEKPARHWELGIDNRATNLVVSLDELRWNAALSVRSAPFERPAEARIAVKIITTTGTEMSLVADVASPEADDS